MPGWLRTGSPVSGHWWPALGGDRGSSGIAFPPLSEPRRDLGIIRSLGHLVAWCGLGPAPEISWACQLDQSVCRQLGLCVTASESSRCPGPAHGFSLAQLSADSTAPSPSRAASLAPQPGSHGTAEGKRLVLLGSTSDRRVTHSWGVPSLWAVRLTPVVLGTAGVDGTARATLLGLKGCARASGLSSKKYRLDAWNCSRAHRLCVRSLASTVASPEPSDTEGMAQGPKVPAERAEM